jgi:hypothetical protein
VLTTCVFADLYYEEGFDAMPSLNFNYNRYLSKAKQAGVHTIGTAGMNAYVHVQLHVLTSALHGTDVWFSHRITWTPGAVAQFKKEQVPIPHPIMIKAYIVARELKERLEVNKDFAAKVDCVELGRIVLRYYEICVCAQRYSRSVLHSVDECALDVVVCTLMSNWLELVLSTQHVCYCVRVPSWIIDLRYERAVKVRSVLHKVGIAVEEPHDLDVMPVVVISRAKAHWVLLSRVVGLHYVLRDTELGDEMEHCPPQYGSPYWKRC